METNIINLSSLDGTNGFRMDGAASYDLSGSSVSSAGDINGDGYADVIVSAYFADPNGNYSGSNYVVFGKRSGFGATIDLSNLDGSNGFRLDGEAAYDNSGRSVSGAGDVNGDGFDDLLIGAVLASPNGAFAAGSSYLVFGKASGFDTTVDLSSLDGSNGFEMDGVANGDLSGQSVSNAGDVNGDGFDDVIIGALQADPKGNYSGSSYVVFGQAGGFAATFNLSTLDGNNGFRLDGVAAYDFAGISVNSAGDVNGDGFSDVIVGAHQADPNGSESGSSYVVFGKASNFDATFDLSSLNGTNGFRLDGIAAYDLSGFSVSNAGDVNGDGFSDLIVGSLSNSSYVVFGKASGFDATLDLSTLDGSNGFRIDGAAAFDVQGFSVSNAGDVNGDGFADLLVSAPNSSPKGNVYAGSSFVIFGKAAGFDSIFTLSNFNNNEGLRLDGVKAGDVLGNSVSGAGDVNGDGFADLVVGAPQADPNGEASGSSYVVFGRNFNNQVTALGTAGADKLKGTATVDRMVAGDGNDTLIGRGGADVFHGGGGNDTIEIRDVSFQLADGGAGTDTLKLDRSHLGLNLADERGRLTDIEAIDMAGQGQNTLTLSALDVLNLSTTSNTLIVDGNHNDRIVAIGSGWNDGGIADGYHAFTNGEATLLVGVQVAIDFG